MPQERLDHWQDRTDEPLLIAAGLFLAAYAVPIIWPALPAWLDSTCQVVTLIVWVAFGLDLVVRVCLAEARIRYLGRNWLDLIAVAVPMLRPLRILRAVLALNALAQRGQPFARGKVVRAVIAAAATLCAVAALAVLDAERPNPGGNIKSLGDAVWWSLTTVTTVGYGDRYPVTTEGRLAAVGLMVTGIALLGVVTAAIASWFVERLSEVENRADVSVGHLAAEIARLREEISALRSERSGEALDLTAVEQTQTTSDPA